LTIGVRRARSGDRRFVEALGAETAHIGVSAIRPADADTTARAFHRLLAFCDERPKTVTLIAESAGIPVGFLLLVTDIPDDVTQSPQAFVAYMAVEPAARRRGAAAKLLAAAEEEARSLGLPHLSLMVTADNAPARALYRRFGFTDERLVLTKRVEPIDS
jgi:ribosomal protein S18 acetylase RimI-like enzyme